jgi:hypothetical protein
VLQGKPTWAWAMRPSSILRPAVILDATKFYTIYSNLGSKTDAYDDTNGALISGPNSSVGQQWVAMPFTPKGNAEVTEIEVAVGHYQGGTNGVTISLNTTESGLPGKPLHTWNLTNLPAFGACCKLDVMKNAKGSKIKKTNQYWVVASTNKSTESTVDVWDRTWNDSSGKNAYNQGSGWKLDNSHILPLVSLGKRPSKDLPEPAWANEFRFRPFHPRMSSDDERCYLPRLRLFAGPTLMFQPWSPCRCS